MLYRDALKKAIDELMEIDDTIVILGEDVGFYGGNYRVTDGLFSKYGEKRVIDTPIAENSIVGNAIGMAFGGLRPVVEIMTVNFSLLAYDQIVNQLAKIRYMSGGDICIPLTIRMPQGVAKQLAAQHSQSFERIFASIPGLKVFTASDSITAYYGLKQAILSDDPVIFLEHLLLYSQDFLFYEINDFDITKQRIVKSGENITLVSCLKILHDSLEAVKEVEKKLGITVEVIELTSLSPLNLDLVYESVKKTKRLVVVSEEPKTGSFTSEIITKVMENCFYYLDAPPLRITAEDTPTPYNRKLELFSIPTPDKIATKIINWGREHGL
ncbi:MAG: alpha-ketoacid dehydrogenase subunit beta [Hydrogenothermaceae bacterium]|nr:alpha-ketoacid dehydrogenase subunit beta [Hydrogenothermaceae bacterium]